MERKIKPKTIKKTGIAEIKKFMDFFNEASLKIRREKPIFTRGKDGWLVKIALKKISFSQLEQLTLWFLERKKNLSTTIGALLSKKVLETLEKDMERADFWKEVNEIYDKYYKSLSFTKELAKKFQPFNFKQINDIKEEVAVLERKTKK